MIPAPQHCAHECVCPDYHASHSEDDYDNPEPCTIPCMQRMEAAAIVNPCEENGCTDIENCDEICDHQRIYSPAQLREKIAAAIAEHDKRPRPPCEECIYQKQTVEHDERVRKEVLDDLKKKFADRYDSGLKNPMVVLDAAMHDIEGSLRGERK